MLYGDTRSRVRALGGVIGVVGLVLLASSLLAPAQERTAGKPPPPPERRPGGGANAPVPEKATGAARDPAEAMFAEGREMFAGKDFGGAADAFAGALERGGNGPMADAARRWLALSLIQQPPPVPAQRIDGVLRAWSNRRELNDPATWNLALRLVLRRVPSADPEQKATAWREGLDALRPNAEGVRLTPESLADLDHFLSLEDRPRGVGRAEVLTDLILLTPDVASVAALHGRLAGPAAEAKHPARERAAAWVQLALSYAGGNDDAFVAAAEAYLKAAGAPEAAAGRPIGPGSTAPFDMRLAQRAQAALADRAGEGRKVGADDDARKRRLAMFHLFAGRANEALRLAYAAVLDTLPSQVPARFDDLAAVAVLASGDLRAAAAETALFRRFGLPDAPAGGAAERFEKALADAAGGEKPAGATAVTDATRDPFRRLHPDAQGQIARRRQAEWARRHASRARTALARRSDGAAVLAWSLSPEVTGPTAGASPLRAVETDLRALNDAGRAAVVTGRLVPLIAGPGARRSAALLQARFLHEAGQMQAALDALDAAGRAGAEEQGAAGAEERAAAGLVRAVTLVKLGRHDEAAAALDAMADLPGADRESRALAAFTRAWIHLSRNETEPALTFLRQVVDEHGGSAYAARSRELIGRLEPPVDVGR